MTFQSSGPIGLNDVQTEFGGSNPIDINEYYGKSGIPASGTISLNDFYGKSNNVSGFKIPIVFNGQYYIDVSRRDMQASYAIRSNDHGSVNCQSLTDGWTNTISNNNSVHPAFFWTRMLNIDGFTDWYVPAKSELEFIYSNRSYLSSLYTFPDGRYWSSTEAQIWHPSGYWLYYEWYLDFPTGSQNHGSKPDVYIIRPIRRIPI